MEHFYVRQGISRRAFLKGTVTGICLSIFNPSFITRGAATPANPLFWVKNIPDNPFYDANRLNRHLGIDSLLQIMGDQGLKFYRSTQETDLSGSSGMIASDDVVLIKVNGQWKYRGCTTGTGYFRIRAWDAFNRVTISDPIPFTVM